MPNDPWTHFGGLFRSGEWGESPSFFLYSSLSAEEDARRPGFSLVPVSSATLLPSNSTLADPKVLSNPFQGISIRKAF